jgi:hypothetical protein
VGARNVELPFSCEHQKRNQEHRFFFESMRPFLFYQQTLFLLQT